METVGKTTWVGDCARSPRHKGAKGCVCALLFLLSFFQPLMRRVPIENKREVHALLRTIQRLLRTIQRLLRKNQRIRTPYCERINISAGAGDRYCCARVAAPFAAPRRLHLHGRMALSQAGNRPKSRLWPVLAPRV
jgi:hypothetical protein